MIYTKDNPIDPGPGFKGKGPGPRTKGVLAYKEHGRDQSPPLSRGDERIDLGTQEAGQGGDYQSRDCLRAGQLKQEDCNVDRQQNVPEKTEQ